MKFHLSGQFNSFPYLLKVIRTGNLTVTIPLLRIQADIDPVNPAFVNLLEVVFQTNPIDG
jgi:hypothetical protein